MVGVLPSLGVRCARAALWGAACLATAAWAGAAAAQTDTPAPAPAAEPGEIQALIGEPAPPAGPDAGAIVRLGPADADWSDDGQPLALKATEWRGLDGRILWTTRRRTTDVSAVRPAGGGDLSCLTQAVYYEARSQSLEGQQGVAQVVMNRAHIPAYGGSVCGAVYQRTARTCQFSFVCDGSMDRRIEPAAWRRAEDVAAKALGGFVFDPLKEATHYHATYVSPAWGFTREELMQIGAHIFYR